MRKQDRQLEWSADIFLFFLYIKFNLEYQIWYYLTQGAILQQLRNGDREDIKGSYVVIRFWQKVEMFLHVWKIQLCLNPTLSIDMCD